MASFPRLWPFHLLLYQLPEAQTSRAGNEWLPRLQTFSSITKGRVGGRQHGLSIRAAAVGWLLKTSTALWRMHRVTKGEEGEGGEHGNVSVRESSYRLTQSSITNQTRPMRLSGLRKITEMRRRLHQKYVPNGPLALSRV